MFFVRFLPLFHASNQHKNTNDQPSLRPSIHPSKPKAKAGTFPKMTILTTSAQVRSTARQLRTGTKNPGREQFATDIDATPSEKISMTKSPPGEKSADGRTAARLEASRRRPSRARNKPVPAAFPHFSHIGGGRTEYLSGRCSFAARGGTQRACAQRWPGWVRPSAARSNLFEPCHITWDR